MVCQNLLPFFCLDFVKWQSRNPLVWIIVKCHSCGAVFPLVLLLHVFDQRTQRHLSWKHTLKSHSAWSFWSQLRIIANRCDVKNSILLAWIFSFFFVNFWFILRLNTAYLCDLLQQSEKIPSHRRSTHFQIPISLATVPGQEFFAQCRVVDFLAIGSSISSTPRAKLHSPTCRSGEQSILYCRFWYSRPKGRMPFASQLDLHCEKSEPTTQSSFS